MSFNSEPDPETNATPETENRTDGDPAILSGSDTEDEKGENAPPVADDEKSDESPLRSSEKQAKSSKENSHRSRQSTERKKMPKKKESTEQSSQDLGPHAKKLIALGEKVRRQEAQKLETEKSPLKSYIALGESYHEAKELAGHGYWMNWLKHHAKIAEQSALNYMSIADHREFLESSKVIVTSVRHALRLIKAKKVAPDPTSGNGKDGVAKRDYFKRTEAMLKHIQKLSTVAHKQRNSGDTSIEEIERFQGLLDKASDVIKDLRSFAEEWRHTHPDPDDAVDRDVSDSQPQGIEHDQRCAREPLNPSVAASSA